MNNRYAEIIKRFRLLDDDFMSEVFENDCEATGLVLQIILKKPDLEVISVVSQKEFKSVSGKTVKLDIFAEDGDGKKYDIEIQRLDRGAIPQRARYNSAMMTANALTAGQSYSELTDTYTIFITENDIPGKGLPLYHITRFIEELNERFNDGDHIIYVNASYKGNDDIGKLMHDFRSTDSDDMNYNVLADRVKFFKEESGVKNMCRLMEEFRDESLAEGQKEIVLNMMKKGLSLEQISELIGLDLDRINKLLNG